MDPWLSAVMRQNEEIKKPDPAAELLKRADKVRSISETINGLTHALTHGSTMELGYYTGFGSTRTSLPHTSSERLKEWMKEEITRLETELRIALNA